MDCPYLVAIGSEHLDAVFLLTCPTSAAPNIAINVDTKSIWYGVTKVTKNSVVGKRA
jgi:hypothetical protein